MIVLDHKIPIRIVKLRALIGRLPVNHPAYPEVQKELTNREAGFKGEKSLDFYLSMLDESKFFILQGKFKYRTYHKPPEDYIKKHLDNKSSKCPKN